MVEWRVGELPGWWGHIAGVFRGLGTPVYAGGELPASPHSDRHRGKECPRCPISSVGIKHAEDCDGVDNRGDYEEDQDRNARANSPCRERRFALACDAAEPRVKENESEHSDRKNGGSATDDCYLREDDGQEDQQRECQKARQTKPSRVVLRAPCLAGSGRDVASDNA